ncbi:MAG TPA: 50S ribosomal protein L24 [Propionibacteriaceae bacterium]|nr:50S ribosomal protein L24 [Propionibacteriaceae bacterium]
MAKTLHVKKGDRVLVISGSDKGKTGEVLKVDVERERVIVSGVNIAKRHKRDSAPQPQSGQVIKGGIISSEAPIHVSNVMLLVKEDGQDVPTRIGYAREEVTRTRPDGTTYTKTRAVRVARKTGERI